MVKWSRSGSNHVIHSQPSNFTTRIGTGFARHELEVTHHHGDPIPREQTTAAAQNDPAASDNL